MILQPMTIELDYTYQAQEMLKAFIFFYLSKIKGQVAHLSTALTQYKKKKNIYIYQMFVSKK